GFYVKGICGRNFSKKAPYLVFLSVFSVLVVHTKIIKKKILFFFSQRHKNTTHFVFCNFPYLYLNLSAMKKYLLLGIGILFFFGILFPQNSSAQNHPVTFQISKGFGKVNGYFKEVDYSIQLHTANPKLSGNATVSSIETNN